MSFSHFLLPVFFKPSLLANFFFFRVADPGKADENHEGGMGTDVQCNRDDNKSTCMVRFSLLLPCAHYKAIHYTNLTMQSEPRHIHKYFCGKGLEVCRITQELWRSTSVN